MVTRIKAHQIEGLSSLAGSGGSSRVEAPLVNYAPSGISVAVDTTSNAHVCFPAAVTLRSGKILTIYRAGAQHGYSSGLIKSKVSTDDGATWTASGTVIDTAADDGGAMGVTQMEDGTVVAAAGIMANGDPNRVGWYSAAAISTDEGATWSDPVIIDDGFGALSLGTNVITLPNGELLFTSMGKDAGTDPYYAAVTVSSDGGQTWARRAVIAKSATENFEEPNLQLMPDGELLCFIRYRREEATTVHEIRMARSVDSGATWTTPVTIIQQASGLPRPHLTKNGLLVLAYRERVTSSLMCAWATSEDRGNTWVQRGNFSGSTDAYVYAGWADLSDGDLGIVYALEVLPDVSADTYFMRFHRGIPLDHLDASIGADGEVVTRVDGRLALAPATGGSSARWEVVMAPGTSSPPVPVETPDGTDWIYVEVSN